MLKTQFVYYPLTIRVPGQFGEKSYVSFFVSYQETDLIFTEDAEFLNPLAVLQVVVIMPLQLHEYN